MALSTAPVVPLEDIISAPLHANEGPVGIPAGFPSVLKTDLAWTGKSFVGNDSYVTHLSADDIKEAELALEKFKTLELDGSEVNKDNFHLPTLGPKLESLANVLYNGRGFCLIRGLDVNKYSSEDLTMIWLGIQSYIAGQLGRQDRNGNMLVHIHADKSTDISAEHHRHSTGSITFHTEEAGDVVGWLTRSAAEAGGRCIIASSHTVYNVLAAARPDLVRVLARSDWPFALPTFQCRPVIYFHDCKFILNFGRTPLLGNAAHPRPARYPVVSAVQLEALDAIEAIAKATQMEIQTMAGDMHFINNFAVLHRRDSFVDGTFASQKRHLVRTRLRNESLAWELPDELKNEWSKAFGPRGDRVWHVEPMPESFMPLRMYPN